MPRYSVYSRAKRPETIRAEADSVCFVKEGFCWWGFFFPLLYLLIKGMWEILVAAILCLVLIGIAAAILGISDLAAIAVSFGLNLIVGFTGNDLYRWTLGRRGQSEVGFASGTDREEAELRFFMELPATAVTAFPGPVAKTAMPDALGLFEPSRPPR